MDNAPEWKKFFVEMIARHVVRQAEPAGVVSEERAAWLLTRVDECRSVEALAALVNVLAEARSVPQWFLDAGRARASGGWPKRRRSAARRDHRIILRASRPRATERLARARLGALSNRVPARRGARHERRPRSRSVSA